MVEVENEVKKFVEIKYIVSFFPFEFKFLGIMLEIPHRLEMKVFHSI